MKMQSKPKKWEAYAKINLTLEVIGKREDGYHEHNGRLHEFGDPGAESWGDPKCADGPEHEAGSKHESAIESASFQYLHRRLMPLRAPTDSGARFTEDDTYTTAIPLEIEQRDSSSHRCRFWAPSNTYLAFTALRPRRGGSYEVEEKTSKGVFAPIACDQPAGLP